MPGSQRNSWSSYLNGGTSQFNFSYKNEEPIEPDTAQPNNTAPQPIQTRKKNNNNMPLLPNTSPSPYSQPVANKKQSGGKRKTKRHTKKYRHSRRK